MIQDIHRHTLIRFAIAFTALCVSGSFFIFEALAIGRYEAQATKIQESITMLNNQVQKKEAAIFTVKTTDELQKQIDAFFVSEEKVPSLLAFIESLSKPTGAKITITSVTDPTASVPDTLGLISIRIEAEGAWNDVIHVVQLLELLPYSSHISELHLSRALSKDAFWDLKTTLSVPFVSS
jgi:hypothetical protein